MDRKATQSEKAPLAISTDDCGSVTDCKFLHAPKPVMIVTPSGIVAEVNDVPLNALDPIRCTDFGMVMEFKLTQPLNAQSPIAVTDSEIVMDLRELHPLKVKSSMMVM